MLKMVLCTFSNKITLYTIKAARKWLDRDSCQKESQMLCNFSLRPAWIQQSTTKIRNLLSWLTRFPGVQRGGESICACAVKRMAKKCILLKLMWAMEWIACCVMIINMIPDLIVYAVRHTLLWLHIKDRARSFPLLQEPLVLHTPTKMWGSMEPVMRELINCNNNIILNKRSAWLWVSQIQTHECNTEDFSNGSRGGSKGSNETPFQG